MRGTLAAALVVGAIVFFARYKVLISIEAGKLTVQVIRRGSK